MRNEVVIQKLIKYADKLTDYCKGYDYASFEQDSKLVEACVFNLSQMGEITKLVDEAYKREHPFIPWYEMYGLRNRIVHDYEGVNLSLVWEIITEDIPKLSEQLRRVLL